MWKNPDLTWFLPLGASVILVLLYQAAFETFYSFCGYKR